MMLIANPLYPQPNDKNAQSGDNALHMAVAEAKDVRIASLLLQYNADPKMDNHVHKTPLDLAEENNDQNMMELLGTQSMTAFAETFRGTTFRVQSIADEILAPTSEAHLNEDVAEILVCCTFIDWLEEVMLTHAQINIQSIYKCSVAIRGSSW